MIPLVMAMVLLVFLILTIALFSILLARGRLIAVGDRRAPQCRHWAVRLICGGLGAASLIVFAVTQIREARGVYDEAERGEKLVLHLPANPTPELPVPAKKGGAEPIRAARVLSHFVFLSRGRPIHAEEFELRLPVDGNRTIQRTGELCGVPFTLDFTLLDLRAVHSPDRTVELRGNATFNLTTQRRQGKSTCGGGFAFGRLGRIASLRLSGSRDSVEVMNVTQLVAPDDPLREVTLNQYAASIGGLPEQVERHAPANRRAASGAPPVFRWISHVGPSVTWLFVAALLLAQLFARRGLAFAGMLTACTLCAAGVDRTNLGRHVDRLTDGAQSEAVRVAAAEALPHTFFYRLSACRAAGKVAGDEQQPKSVRAAAEAARAELELLMEDAATVSMLEGIEDLEESALRDAMQLERDFPDWRNTQSADDDLDSRLFLVSSGIKIYELQLDAFNARRKGKPMPYSPRLQKLKKDVALRSETTTAK